MEAVGYRVAPETKITFLLISYSISNYLINSHCLFKRKHLYDRPLPSQEGPVTVPPAAWSRITMSSGHNVPTKIPPLYEDIIIMEGNNSWVNKYFHCPQLSRH